MITNCSGTRVFITAYDNREVTVTRSTERWQVMRNVRKRKAESDWRSKLITAKLSVVENTEIQTRDNVRHTVPVD